MKFSAALAALTAVALAPFAAAQTCTDATNQGYLDNLAVSHSIKKTTVNGGARVVQTITVKNNGQTAAQGLVLTTTPGADLPLIKGRLSIAQAHGTPKPTIASQSGVPTSTTFSIPAGKTLKATLAYKAANCPALANPHLVSTFVAIPTDANANCYITPADGSVTINKKKNCPP